MPHRTTAKKSIKCGTWPLTRVRVLVNALTRALFDASDAAARRYGWQVTSTRHGFGRLYRDPRFDAIRICPACRGHGVQTDGTECLRCRGSGRIVIKPGVQPLSDPPPGRLT
jgi:DnaJ-class molecular chaperone